MGPADEVTAFVLANTRLLSVAEAPDVALFLADEVTPLWHATQDILAEGNAPPPYWAFAWPGSRAFVLMIRADPACVAGRRVLDVATGCGLAALVAAQAGAASVTANDIDPYALAATRLAAQRNGLVVETWGGDLTALPVAAIDAEVILVGDVCYEKDTADRFMGWLQALAGLGKTVYLADPGRKFGPKDGVEPIATYYLATSLDLETATTKETAIWRVLAVV